MIRVQLTVDADVLKAIDDAARDAPRLMQTAYERQTRRLRQQIQEEARREPGKPKYPIQWTSERQRIAFFASNGFGRGIPSRRSGALIKSMRVVLTADAAGGLLAIQNDAPYARWVVGDDIQRFHRQTGWKPIDELAAKWQPIAVDRLRETWRTVVDPRAGVRGTDE